LLPPAIVLVWGVRLAAGEAPRVSPWRLLALPVLVIFAAIALTAAFPLQAWPVESGMGGISGRLLLAAAGDLFRRLDWPTPRWLIAIGAALCTLAALGIALGVARATWVRIGRAIWAVVRAIGVAFFAAAAWIVAIAFRRRGRAAAAGHMIEIPTSP